MQHHTTGPRKDRAVRGTWQCCLQAWFRIRPASGHCSAYESLGCPNALIAGMSSLSVTLARCVMYPSAIQPFLVSRIRHARRNGPRETPERLVRESPRRRGYFITLPYSIQQYGSTAPQVLHATDALGGFRELHLLETQGNAWLLRIDWTVYQVACASAS